MKYPGLITGVVPEKISYGILAEVFRKFMSRGNSALYLPRIIEYLEVALKKNPEADIDELVEYVSARLEVENNFWVYLNERK